MDDGLQWLLAQNTDINHTKLFNTSEERSSYLQSAATALQALPPPGAHYSDMTGMDEHIEGLSRSLGWCFFASNDASALKVSVLDQIPNLFRWLSEHGPHDPDGAIFMFWDSVRPGKGIRAPVKDAMFSALAHQLFLPDDTIQASAAHGFNHLKDPRSLPLLAHRARTTSNTDLRAYLTAACGFNLM